MDREGVKGVLREQKIELLTNASTTGLLDTRVMKWADQVAEALAVRIKMFPRLRAAGEAAGPAVDTAAAVAGVPAADGALAFVCTGTWQTCGPSSGAACTSPGTSRMSRRRHGNAPKRWCWPAGAPVPRSRPCSKLGETVS